MESSSTFGMTGGFLPYPHINSSPHSETPLNTPWFLPSLTKTQDGGKWKYLDLLYLPFEVETILKIPFSYNLPDDNIIWLGNKKREFIMKSAYHIAYKLVDNLEDGKSSLGDLRTPIWQNL